MEVLQLTDLNGVRIFTLISAMFMTSLIDEEKMHLHCQRTFRCYRITVGLVSLTSCNKKMYYSDLSGIQWMLLNSYPDINN